MQRMNDTMNKIENELKRKGTIDEIHHHEHILTKAITKDKIGPSK